MPLSAFNFETPARKRQLNWMTRRAQKNLLGHKQQSMADHYIRARKGERVKPFR
jgi:hypothetical protein